MSGGPLVCAVVMVLVAQGMVTQSVMQATLTTEPAGSAMVPVTLNDIAIVLTATRKGISRLGLDQIFRVRGCQGCVQNLWNGVNHETANI